jgi:glutamate/tyrosine decarboxylase-like PLP-dependent enzyme
MTYSKTPEETLDPENWDEFSVLGHRMLEDTIQYLKTIREQQITLPDEKTIEQIYAPLTEEGEGEEKVYQVFKHSILPHLTGSTKPTHWGWVVGPGTPYGMLADMLASGANCPDEDWVASTYCHRQVINWIKQLLDYPQEAGGVLVYGGTEANFTGLAVARNAKAEVDMKAKGMQGVPRKMTLYVSDEGHHCLERSVELTGLGNESLRWVPTDDECRIRIDRLEEAIRRDRADGFYPFCVIGCAGTVNSGAFDDFNALAEVASREKMWFHVDAAFGGWVKLSETHRWLADGMERADSLAIDLHKWMYMPYGIGCTLVRDRVAHLITFVYGHEAEYLKGGFDAFKDMLDWPAMLGLPLSRYFVSLKAYMLLRAYGKGRYRRLIQQNLDQVAYLEGLIRGEECLEITAPVSSNVACFRYNPGGLDEAGLKELNKAIMGELWKVHFGLVSDTTIKGRYTLRACNVNHRTRREDFDWLVAEVKRIGSNLAKGIRREY